MKENTIVESLREKFTGDNLEDITNMEIEYVLNKNNHSLASLYECCRNTPQEEENLSSNQKLFKNVLCHTLYKIDTIRDLGPEQQYIRDIIGEASKNKQPLPQKNHLDFENTTMHNRVLGALEHKIESTLSR